MGLDMYLTAEKYLFSFNEADKAKAEKIAQTVDTRRRVKSIQMEAAYWRKANAIHGWFVDNVQDGTDDCKSYYVSRGKLEELRDLCRQIYELKDAKRAESELPPCAGFFFGNTDIDQYYWDDLKSTDEQLTAALTDESLTDCEFYYQSSW